MAAVIRLRQHGTKNAKTYRLVLTDRNTPRDGKYKEKLGWYIPQLTDDKNLYVNAERVEHWLSQGAEITDNALALVKRFAPEMVKSFAEKKREAKAKKGKSK